ncbi:MAG: squalene--hopene cyclase [Alphaproteobacteria bacterium]|nr:squalene--hopene cyclase [Alphaproteobacteria bacterium]
MAIPSSPVSETDALTKIDTILDTVIEESRQDCFRRQAEDGHWVFELEADATIPSEYILFEHFFDEIDDDLEKKIAVYLRRRQSDRHGGWALFHGGDFDMSASVKAYFALKMVGDDVDTPHMKRAREAILSRGGAAKANVFTRITLALFGQVPWRAVPVMPVEISLLPKWFPFHMDKVSYWSRTVIAPLLIVMAYRPKAKNPRKVDICELFVTPPEEERHYHVNPMGSLLGAALLRLDTLLRIVEPCFPKGLRQRAVEKALAFTKERLNGEDGIGAIFPAMVNSVMAFDCLGYPKDHPDVLVAKKAIRRLLVIKEDEAYCQPCFSPVWDTGLMSLALQEAPKGEEGEAHRKALDWLAERQILDVVGDWAAQRPGLRPGGWAFQYWNDHYPDVDDTAVVAMALHRFDKERYSEAIDRAAEWIFGMQSANGGWGAFDAENAHYGLNHIPFADHGALLDPPTVDVSARCLGFLAQIGYSKDYPVVARGIAFLKREQEENGSWFGRWGTNYVYGTWSALSAFQALGEDPAAPHIRKAVAWLKARQREDGGWGEDGATYWKERRDEAKESTASQTAWAVLGLLAAGEVESAAVKRGIAYLLKAPRTGTKWQEEWYTAVGFPRVFYLRYHGYSAYFPVWALTRYRNLLRGNAPAKRYGM